ncbi:MAG: hypothetical protein ACE5G8_09315 [Anaerolineae bacterium]
MDILQLVDELEAAISKSFRIPFTSNIVVNEDDLFDIIDQMRISIPQEIKEAKRTEAERERILARAKEESNRLVNLAKEKIMTAVDDHEIIEAAKVHAKETIINAEQEAVRLKLDSDNYVADNLSNLEEYLLKLLTTVRNGLRQVQQTRQPLPPAAEETVEPDA